MKKFAGKGVYGAVAIGRISIFKKKDLSVKRVHRNDTAGGFYSMFLPSATNIIIIFLKGGSI